MYNYGVEQKNKYQLKTESSDNKKCILKFSNCDEKNYSMQKLSSNNIKEFVSYAKKVEALTWAEIKSHTGLKFEMLPELEPPSFLSKDVTLFSMRVTQKFRIIGYRVEDVFYLVWFDKNHKTC